MSRRRRLGAAALLCALFGLSTAAASIIPTSSARVASGNAAVSRCDADGVTVAYSTAYDTTVADYRTTAVTVASIATACVGRTLSVTVRSSTGPLWQGAATVTATSVSLTTSSITSSSIAGWAVSITG